MSAQPSRCRHQGGAALLAVMLTLLLAITYLGYRSAHPPPANARAADLNARLLLARDALIARAITDANRPGSLPCPDLLTDDNGLNNHPGDGKADNLVRNDCPAYLGWLPWVTLDLPDLADDAGSRFWYVLARPLRDDDLAYPINSDTPLPLRLDGHGDIAALIIAPGAALNGQQRPSHRPGDYLDGSNADGDNLYRSGPADAGFNDSVLALTRQALMSAVEKRVAGEVHACLEQHAAALANVRHDYPWPAPFSATGQRGRAGSLFGQLPASQPGPGPQALLAASRGELQSGRTRLLAAATAPEQLAALNLINEQLNYAKTLYDRLYSSAKNLALIAKGHTLAFADLDGTLGAAQANGRISVSERRSIQSGGESAATQLALLQQSLADSGLDAFPDELAARQQNLRNQITLLSSAPGAPALDLLQEAAGGLLSLFSASHTGNATLSRNLDEALALGASAIVAARTAIASPTDPATLTHAAATARALDDAGNRLQAAIAGERILLHPDELDAHANQLEISLASIVLGADARSDSELAQRLRQTHELIAGINPASSLASLRSDSLNALDAALQASSVASSASSTRQAIAHLQALSQAMRRHGDNLTRDSLAAAGQRFSGQLATFANIVTRTQADMLPYAEALQLAAVDLRFWAEIIERQAGTVATLARKAPAASKSQSNPTAAYSLADSTLNSINASSGALKKLQDSIAAPNSTTKATAARNALAETITRLDTLMQGVQSLEAAVHGSQADAFPMLWYSSRCNFLQPDSESTSWWQANQWTHTTFFQIGARARSGDGRLTVNGSAGYHSIVINSGTALSHQQRSNRRSADFFEGVNADPGRDGDATAPARHFVSQPASARFNDRLAY